MVAEGMPSVAAGLTTDVLPTRAFTPDLDSKLNPKQICFPIRVARPGPECRSRRPTPAAFEVPGPGVGAGALTRYAEAETTAALSFFIVF